ncbi:MAG: hypothetical protein U1D67_05130 [Dehalococcoidia bacterium]|nr:hypothetical protein [Dehalococcoidia bacterium]MDZ4246488.1 hypothetical protein [Dehalococcoidia bacterium]
MKQNLQKKTRRITGKAEKAARSRLRMELAGLAFAVAHGYTPQRYARHLWGKGAVKWMGKGNPSMKEYLEKEIEVMDYLFPWLGMELVEVSPDRVEVRFEGGCLGGWGEEDRWALARSLGLDRWDVCRYCGEAFKTWAKQLGLKAAPHPARDGSCRLVAWKWPEEGNSPGK